MQSPPNPDRADDRGEWTYLTYDVDRPCVVCLNYLHRGQAVGQQAAARILHQIQDTLEAVGPAIVGVRHLEHAVRTEFQEQSRFIG